MICSSTKSVDVGCLGRPRQLRIQLVLDLHRAGHDHEKKHDHENDVDHRRDLKPDVAFVGIELEAHRYSLFVAENEMSLMPASAQAFIACET